MSRSVTILVAIVAAALVVQVPLITGDGTMWPDVSSAGRILPSPTALAADFTFAPEEPVTGEIVTFSATASDGTPPYIFDWDFGDTGVGTGETVVHSYSNDGTFTVTLTVTDAEPLPPNVTTVSKPIVVANPLTADFTFSPSNPVVGQTVTS